jgi:hypothetical protein
MPIACLDRIGRDVVAPVGDKAETDAKRFGHRLTQRPDPIELSYAPTFHKPPFLRAEGSACKSGKVAVGPVVLNIDPDCGIRAERAGEPSPGVRQRNRGGAPAVRSPDEWPPFGLDPESTVEWRHVRHLDQ